MALGQRVAGCAPRALDRRLGRRHAGHRRHARHARRHAGSLGPRRLDLLVGAVAAGLVALPSFLVAMALLLVFGAGLGWFPLHGGRSPVAPPSLPGSVLDTVWHLALPGATLVVVQAAAFALLSRGVMGELRRAPYLAAARAKGLPEGQVIWRHALPNALPTLATLLGLRLGHVFGGAIVVERVFSVPGLGLLAVEAVAARDYAVMQTVFLLGGLWVLLVAGLMELAYRLLVPQAAWIERPG
ncbi:MAG: ABC transporter permease [Chloroflexi bacterium]|nr:ABC transporter permease [Chloroflexota bacterium]MBI4507229.1 ABC transporter permease [Chloroflexota bacterium]